MASQDIVVPEELRSAEANPSKVSCLHPKLDYAKQSWIGVNLDIEERNLAEFYVFAKSREFVNINNFSFSEAARFQLLNVGVGIAITRV